MEKPHDTARVRRPIRASYVAGTIAAVAVFAAVPARGVEAQIDRPALTIERVMAVTLERNPDVRAAQAAVDVERGARVEAARPFDSRALASVEGSRVVTPASTGFTTPASPAYTTLGTGLQLGLNKVFRSGMVLASQVDSTQFSSGLGQASPVNRLATTAELTLPLMYGRAGGIALATERAAVLDYTASRHTLRATAASALLRATLAYWNLHAAYRRADIQRAAADRSRTAVDEVRILIAADERPRSDLDLMLANAATKLTAALEAQRQIEDARSTLAEVMGLDMAPAAQLQTPATDFPAPADTPVQVLDALVAAGVTDHDELAAARTREARARVLRDGTARELKPRFDVVVGAGYIGHLGGPSLEDAFSAAHGPNASLRFVYEPSRLNSAIRGAIISAEAEHAQAVTASEAVARGLRLDFARALTDLRSSWAQLASVEEAVTRSRSALETVQRNFELGTSTVFDRILAEDVVTNAELATLSARLRYASALANLQFARGVLLDRDTPVLTARASRVLRAILADAQ